MENLSIQQLGVAIAGGAAFMWFFYSIFMKGRTPMFTADTAVKMRDRELRESELKLEECHKRLEEAHADVAWWESRKLLLEATTARLRTAVAEDLRNSPGVIKGSGQLPPSRPVHRPDLGDFTNEPREGAKVSRVAPPANP